MEASGREWKKDWTNEVWNVTWANEPNAELGANLTALWVPNSNDSKYEMVTITKDNTPEIAVWSAEFYSKLTTFKDDFYPLGFDLVGNTGKAVVCGAYNNAAYSVWDLEKGERLRHYTRSEPAFESAAIREGSILLSTFQNGVSQFDLETGRPGKKIETTCREGIILRGDPFRPSVVYVGNKKLGAIAAYDLRTNAASPARSLLGLNGALAGMNIRIFSNENHLIAATENQVRVFDVSNGKTLHTITHLPAYRTYRQVDLVKGYAIVALDYEGLHFYNIAGGDVKEPEYALAWSGLQAYEMAATPDAIVVNYVTNLRRALLP